MAPRRLAIVGLLAVSCGRERHAAPPARPAPSPVAPPLPPARTDQRQRVLGAVGVLLAAHGSSRARLEKADALFRDGEFAAPAYAAELDYQLTVRDQCRRDGAALLAEARGDADLTALVVDVVHAVDLGATAVRLRREQVADRFPHRDAAAWRRTEDLEAVVAARCEAAARRHRALASQYGTQAPGRLARRSRLSAPRRTRRRALSRA